MHTHTYIYLSLFMLGSVFLLSPILVRWPSTHQSPDLPPELRITSFLWHVLLFVSLSSSHLLLPGQVPKHIVTLS